MELLRSIGATGLVPPTRSRSSDQDDYENPSLRSVDTRTREFHNSEDFQKMLDRGLQATKKEIENIIKKMVAEGKINANNIRTIQQKESLLMSKVDDEWRKRLEEEAWEYRRGHHADGDNNIQITIRIPNRVNIVLNHLVAEDTIALVKYIIEQETQIKADAFNLANDAHRSLDDDKTLQFYNIGDGSTLILGIKMVTSRRQISPQLRRVEGSERHLIGVLADLADNAATFNQAGDIDDILSYLPDAIKDYITTVEQQQGGRNRTRKRKNKRRRRKKTRRRKQGNKRRRTKRRRTMRKA